MYLSIFAFTGASFAAFAVFLVKLDLLKIKLPQINKSLFNIDSSKKLYIEIALCCIISRLTIYILGILGYMLVKNQPLDFFNSFTTLFSKWDGDHYTFIAENWYVTYGDKRYLLVFFPLYPIAIKIISLVFVDYAASGIIVSNTFLILGCIYLYKLTVMDFDRDTAFRAVKYLLLFPVSFFLGATFSESMFFALSVATIYYWRNKKLTLSALLAFMAALTRSFGLLLVIPMAIDFILELKKDSKSIITKGIYNRLLNILSPFLGIAVYLIINLQVSGNPLTFMKYQREHWSQRIGFFGNTIRMLTENALGKQPSEIASLWLPQLLIIFLTLALLCYSVKHLNISYVAYMLGYIFLTISPTWLLSAPRYLMCLFPMLIILGYAGRRRHLDFIITLILATGLGFCTIAFVNGYFIM